MYAIDYSHIVIAFFSKLLFRSFSMLMEFSHPLGNLVIAFHRYLSECLNNTLLESFSESMTDWLLDQRKKSLQAPNQLQNALLDHKSIYAGLKKHDPDKAEKAMREHLYRVEQAYSSVVSFKK